MWRIALALLDDAYDGAPPLHRLALFDAIAAADVRVTRQMIATDINTPRVHGLGRLFDGIGALGLVRRASQHEGQIAMAWNHAAEGPGAYPIALDHSGAIPWQLDHCAAGPRRWSTTSSRA